MKIALLGTYQGHGGIQTHLHWLSRALLERGHEVDLFSLGAPLDVESMQRVSTLAGAGRFQVHEAAGGGGARRRATRLLTGELSRLGPDLLLSCGTGWNLFLPPILSHSPRRIFHEVMSGTPRDWKDSRWMVRYGFHEVVAQASAVAENFRRTFHWPHPIPVLPAFPEPLEITAGLSFERPRRPPAPRPRAAYFGRMVPHKRALWLARNWPRLSRTLSELHFHGTGPEAKEIRHLAASEGWADRVFVHGPYPEGREYVDLLRRYDLTLLPTIGAEGAPLVLLESMACGVPFVSTDAGGIRDYENGDCLIVPQNQDGAFLGGIEKICARLARGDIESDRLARHYQNHFSYAALQSRWADFLERRQIPASGRSPA